MEPGTGKHVDGNNASEEGALKGALLKAVKNQNVSAFAQLVEHQPTRHFALRAARDMGNTRRQMKDLAEKGCEAAAEILVASEQVIHKPFALPRAVTYKAVVPDPDRVPANRRL